MTVRHVVEDLSLSESEVFVHSQLDDLDSSFLRVDLGSLWVLKLAEGLVRCDEVVESVDFALKNLSVIQSAVAVSLLGAHEDALNVEGLSIIATVVIDSQIVDEALVQ